MKKVWIISAVLLIVTGWLWWWLQPEQVIKRRTRSLVELVDLGRVSGVGVMDVHAIGRLIADSMQVEAEFVADQPVPVSPTEVEMAYRWLGDNATHSEFDLIEMGEVKLEERKATLVTRIRGRLDLEDRRLVEGEYQVVFVWRQTEDGAWRLARMSWR